MFREVILPILRKIGSLDKTKSSKQVGSMDVI